MLRINLILALALTICALAVVSSQHQARKLFRAIEAEQERARSLDVEYGQLQIEQSTWAVHTRVERVAIDRLKMHRPDGASTLRPAAVSVDSAAAGER